MKIDFEFNTEYGVFRDALYFPDDQEFTDLQIEEMKQERVNNWIAVVTSPPAPPIESEPFVDEVDDA